MSRKKAVDAVTKMLGVSDEVTSGTRLGIDKALSEQLVDVVKKKRTRKKKATPEPQPVKKTTGKKRTRKKKQISPAEIEQSEAKRQSMEIEQSEAKRQSMRRKHDDRINSQSSDFDNDDDFINNLILTALIAG